MTWRAWHFGLPLRMTSRITQIEAPAYFIDEQVKEPFKSLRHIHEFRQDSERTTMLDHIEFEAPFGIIGLLTEKLILARYMQKRLYGIERGEVALSSVVSVAASGEQ